MFRFLVILALGVALGYAYGFRDAQTNDRTVAARALDRVVMVGGDGRKYSSANADAELRRAER